MRIGLIVLLLAAAGCTAAAPPPILTPAATPQTTTKPQVPSNQEINDRFVQQIAEQIADRKDQPSHQVFRNIQLEWMKEVPAGRLLTIMNRGYSHALGVTCTHCHLEQDFASDEKRPKRAAREMALMHRMINDRLQSMQDLQDSPSDRMINCFTCHRGTVDPTKTDS